MFIVLNAHKIGPPKIGPYKAAHIYPYLLRKVTASFPNQVWGIITYIRLQQGWMYLVAVLDWYSRYIISWQLDDTLEIPFVLTAVDQALSQAKPLICNSDQGSHFTSPLLTLRPILFFKIPGLDIGAHFKEKFLYCFSVVIHCNLLSYSVSLYGPCFSYLAGFSFCAHSKSSSNSILSTA